MVRISRLDLGGAAHGENHHLAGIQQAAGGITGVARAAGERGGRAPTHRLARRAGASPRCGNARLKGRSCSG